ncbi:HmuY family protein [Paraflavitalea speifideaquila]|uniref:HmuY family protein n=1 Tax=Paraflavitalea speifideaquila TaxID=3076558 RepID=UPI0028E55D12|nr:HmuY family protein [Paraflavitalea speifideiaquila]
MSTKLKLSHLLLCTAFSIALASCSKDDKITIPPPSDGKTETLNGGAGGANAANSVYLDMSTDKQDSAKRTSWDLGFYSGTDFRVIINNTTAATAKAINKTDLSLVTVADTTGFADALALGQGAGTFSIIDDVDGDLTKTVIPAVSATDADNKIYILKPSNGMVAAPAIGTRSALPAMGLITSSNMLNCPRPPSKPSTLPRMATITLNTHPSKAMPW